MEGKGVNLGAHTMAERERSQGNASRVRFSTLSLIIEATKVATKPKIRGTQKRHGGLGSVVAQIRGRI